MSIFISLVSHNHAEMIMKTFFFQDLAAKYNVVLKNNVGQDSSVLNVYCKANKIHLIDNNYGIGFGSNNNINFKYCVDVLGMQKDDIFILINPDVAINTKSIDDLIALINKYDADVAGISLFKDEGFKNRDLSVRKYPTFISFFSSLLGIKRECYFASFSAHEEAVDMEWVAGSFIAFKSSSYRKVQGFDENYFMYCEDIDICYRAKSQGMKLLYFPQIKAVHTAQHNNRKIFSKHFLWHLTSALRFILSKHIRLSVNSSIK
ncbi:galactosyltransferase-related protein [Pantoea ananatis]|uniref:galactosyltransferase-related protein n=1 Tax=Pantoea ananas TaxID=553 RepID=UPI0021F7CA29|nr:glycosyltransferase family 2 protein [Pantoea ananatis]